MSVGDGVVEADCAAFALCQAVEGVAGCDDDVAVLIELGGSDHMALAVGQVADGADGQAVAVHIAVVVQQCVAADGKRRVLVGGQRAVHGKGDIAGEGDLVGAGVLLVVVIVSDVIVVIVIVGHFLLAEVPGADGEGVVSFGQAVDLDVGVLDVGIIVMGRAVGGAEVAVVVDRDLVAVIVVEAHHEIDVVLDAVAVDILEVAAAFGQGVDGERPAVVVEGPFVDTGTYCALGDDFAFDDGGVALGGDDGAALGQLEGDGGGGIVQGHRIIVDRGQVEAGAACHGRGAVGHLIADIHLPVVIGRRGESPGAVAVVGQASLGGIDGDVGYVQCVAGIHIGGMGQQVGGAEGQRTVLAAVGQGGGPGDHRPIVCPCDVDGDVLPGAVGRGDGDGVGGRVAVSQRLDIW